MNRVSGRILLWRYWWILLILILGSFVAAAEFLVVGGCASSEYSAGAARVRLSACLQQTGVSRTGLQEMRFELKNVGPVALWTTYVCGFMYNIYNSSQSLLSIADCGLASYSGRLLIPGASLRWDRALGWVHASLNNGKEIGTYFAQGAWDGVFNVTFPGITPIGTELMETPLIEYQVVDQVLFPFSVFQAAVVLLLSVNVIISLILLLRIQKLLNQLSPQKTVQQEPKP